MTAFFAATATAFGIGELRTAVVETTAAGAAGWWLESRREHLRVPDSALETIHKLAPRQNRYALGATVGQGQAAPGWGVILPRAFVDQRFEGL